MSIGAFFRNLAAGKSVASPGNPQQFSHTAWQGFNPQAEGMGLVANWPLPKQGIGGTFVQRQMMAFQPGVQVFQQYAPPLTNLLNGYPQGQFVVQGLSVENSNGSFQAAPDFIMS